jgi:hypothetical protein
MVHGVPPLSAMRAPRVLEWVIMHAECAGVSGPSYYAAGPDPDVLGRLRQGEAVLHVPQVRLDPSARRALRPAPDFGRVGWSCGTALAGWKKRYAGPPRVVAGRMPGGAAVSGAGGAADEAAKPGDGGDSAGESSVDRWSCGLQGLLADECGHAAANTGESATDLGRTG